MKKIFSIFLISLMCGFAFADEKSDKEEMMRVWKEYSKPGPEHKQLTSLAGKWKYQSKVWQAEGARPELSSGTAYFRPVLGGRFIQQEVHGKAMGMPFEGLGIIGYNNLKKTFETIWADNFGTGFTRGTATFDQASKTLKEEGAFTCPKNGGAESKYRAELTWVDRRTLTYTFFSSDLKTNKEFKSMEMTYKRSM